MCVCVTKMTLTFEIVRNETGKGKKLSINISICCRMFEN